MATEETAPKRSGLGWIPKLSLWAVVIAFGYLYLSSIERDPAGDTTQAAVADESGVEAGGFQKIMDKLGDFTSSAETVIADVTAAGADGFNQVVDKVKELTGTAEPRSADEPVSDAAPAEVAKAEPAAAEPADVAPAVVETSAAAQESAAKPASMRVAEERPVASAFNRHSAPLPATAARTTSPVSEPEVPVQESASAETIADSPPMKDAEATVFAESLMGDESPAETASASVEAPASAPIQQGFVPVPVVPQPFARAEIAPAPAGVAPALEDPRESAAQYRARMMAEYESMRRAADQRAREYWERMQAPAPAGYPGYGPGYGPVYGPGYGAPVYQR
jgi:hypothetical protein